MIQNQVLNYLLNTKDCSFITHHNINEDYFSDYRDEFRFIKKHLDTYGNICDKETFLSVFDEFTLREVSETSDCLWKKLNSDKNKRALIEGLKDVKQLLKEDKIDDAIKYIGSFSDNMSSEININSIDLFEDTTRYDDYVEKTRNVGKYFISTGFKELDAVLGGWDREDELATVVARTNKGKSWILLKFATECAKQGLKVGLYSGEMSENKVGYRLDTLLGHVNNGGITHGNIQFEQDYRRYFDETLPEIKKKGGTIKVLTPKLIGGSADVGALRAFIEKEHLDVLCIDQYSLLDDMKHGKSLPERMSNISWDLKNLQVMKRIPILSVCQQNRTATESGEQDTTQIAGSDRIGQDSTVVLFLDRVKIADKDAMEIKIGKARDAEVGKKLTYLINLNVGSFTYVPDANETQTSDGDDYASRYDTPSIDGDEEVF